MELYKGLLDSVKLLGDGIIKTVEYEDGFIILNLTDRKLCVLDDKIIAFDNILDVSVSSETKRDPRVELANAFASSEASKTTTNTGSIVGRSLVGGLVGGVPGAIIGGMTAEKKTEVFHTVDSRYEDYTITIIIKDLINPTLSIHMGNDRETVEEIANLFKAVLASKDTVKGNAMDMDKSSYLSSMYSKARKLKAEISVTANDFVMNADNESLARDLYLQILSNDVSSKEAQFYYFFFKSLSKPKYSQTLGKLKLFDIYKEKIAEYIEELKLADFSSMSLSFLVKDTLLYAHYLGGGYIDEWKFGYLLPLAVGDIVFDKFGKKAYSIVVPLWKTAVSNHHKTPSSCREKFDISNYVQKIQEIEGDYVEPQINKDYSFYFDKDFVIGIIVLLFIACVIVYLIAS